MATVIDGDFEWDERKAEANLAKHGVSFPEAATVFADPAAVYLDDGSGTDRTVVVGTSCATGCFMSFTSSVVSEIASSALARPRAPSEMSMNLEEAYEFAGPAPCSA